MDFPTAWEIARSWPYDEHAELCSYRTTEGGVLCDCLILDNGEKGPLAPQPVVHNVEVIATDSTVFVNEEEAIAEEAAWADQMAEEMALVPASSADVVVVEDSEVESYPDDIDPPINPLDIPDHYDLPMHGSILACPKCGGDKSTEDGKIKGLRTYYHEHGILHAPCGQRFGWPDVQNLGEHLCRVCDKCGYGWPEQVFHGTA